MASGLQGLVVDYETFFQPAAAAAQHDVGHSHVWTLRVARLRGLGNPVAVARLPWVATRGPRVGAKVAQHERRGLGCCFKEVDWSVLWWWGWGCMTRRPGWFDEDGSRWAGAWGGGARGREAVTIETGGRCGMPCSQEPGRVAMRWLAV